MHISLDGLHGPNVDHHDDFVRILFGPEAMAHDWVVEKDRGAVFATPCGDKTCIWLEDMYVRPTTGGRASPARYATRCARRPRAPGWEALEWNVPALDFYQRLGAQPMAGWTRYRWVEG